MDLLTSRPARAPRTHENCRSFCSYVFAMTHRACVRGCRGSCWARREVRDGQRRRGPSAARRPHQSSTVLRAYNEAHSGMLGPGQEFRGCQLFCDTSASARPIVAGPFPWLHDRRRKRPARVSVGVARKDWLGGCLGLLPCRSCRSPSIPKRPSRFPMREILLMLGNATSLHDRSALQAS